MACTNPPDMQSWLVTSDTMLSMAQSSMLGAAKEFYLHYVDPSIVQRYVGIDVSSAALARAKAISGAHFLHCSAEDYHSSDNFAAIIFPYFTKDPVGTLARFLSMLNDDGVFVISMFDHSSLPSAARAIARLWNSIRTLPISVLDEVRLTNTHKQLTWAIAAARVLRNGRGA